jgi:hypothetical protein
MLLTDPMRYRQLMLASIIEKYSYGIAVLALFWQERIAMMFLVFGLIDTLLGTLSAISY